MYFTVICFDRPGAAPVRLENAPAHLRYLDGQGSTVYTGGPLLDPLDGHMLGSLYIIDVEDYDRARTFIEGEPLYQAGLFESVAVRGWTRYQPEIEPGANEASAREIERQLTQSGRSS